MNLSFRLYNLKLEMFHESFDGFFIIDSADPKLMQLYHSAMECKVNSDMTP